MQALPRVRLAAGGSRVGTEMPYPPWLVVYKPSSAPFFSPTQLQYGIFQQNDTFDCLATRLMQQLNIDASEAIASTEGDEESSPSPVQFPLTGQNWFSHGATMVALDPDAASFLSSCESLAAIQRRYHVLCRVPHCLTTEAAIEAAAEAQLLAQGGKKRIWNPSITRLVRRQSVEAAREVIAQNGVAASSIPSCVRRNGQIRCEMLRGRVIERTGQIVGAFSTLEALSRSPTAERSRRIADLFVAKHIACDPRCGCSSQRDVFHPASHSNPHTLVPVAISGGAAAKRPVELDFKLLHYDDTAKLALFDVLTATASESQLRCAFAGVGLPVLHDPEYDMTFRKEVETLASSASAVAAPPFSITRQRPARREDRILKHLLASDREFVGIGVRCAQIIFPDPMSVRNRDILLHASALARDWNARRAADKPWRTTIRSFDCFSVETGDSRAFLAAVGHPEYPPAGAMPTATAPVVRVDGVDRLADESASPDGNDELLVVQGHSAEDHPVAAEGTSVIKIDRQKQEVTSGKQPLCRYCFGNHSLDKCTFVVNKDQDEAWCIRCARKGHTVATCQYSRYARIETKRCIVCDIYDPDHTAEQCPRAVAAPQSSPRTEAQDRRQPLRPAKARGGDGSNASPRRGKEMRRPHRPSEGGFNPSAELYRTVNDDKDSAAW